MNYPSLSYNWSFQDYWGAFRVRLGLGRSSYRIDPGLYTLGTPGEEDPILVTANYKLSADHLRRALRGRNAWILVLDTKGVNVWCAAGKGTFGTEELIHRIEETDLSGKKGNRLLILPQLGAPGVCAPRVERATGFRVVYGPVRAKDLPDFIDSGLKATGQMRRVTFSLPERVVLIPVELTGAILPTILLLCLLSLIGALATGAGALLGFNQPHRSTQHPGSSPDLHSFLEPGSGAPFLASLLWVSFQAFFPLLPAAILEVILFPILLPLLPGRAFSFKGTILAVLGIGAFLGVASAFPGALSPILSSPVRTSPALLFRVLPYVFLLGSTVSFLAMNFTGSTPFTSLSGVLKEMRIALPLQLGAFLVGTAWLWIDLFMRRGTL
ncbi:MAG: mercury methylation corrinoid protein HgcA [Spirochaetales bacterium]